MYDKSFFSQCLNVIIQFFDVAAALTGLTGISLSDGIEEILKYVNLSFTLNQALINEDYETYINTLIDAAKEELEEDEDEDEDEDEQEETKSGNYNMSWAKELFELSDSFGELADILASRPNFYNEIFANCASNEDYRIFFEYNNGPIEEVSDISSKLN